MANQVDRSSTIQGYRRSKDSQRYPPTAPPSLVSSVHITPGGTPSVSPRIKDCASNTTTAIKSSSSQPVKERQILSSSVRPAVASTADIGPRSCPTKTPDEHIAGAISILLPIRAPLSDITLTPDPEAREFEFRHCNECEDGNPDYKGCNHPDDPASFSPLPADNTLFDPYAISTTTVVLHDHARFDRPLYLLDFYEMIRTHALAALFTENLEKDSDTVNGIFLCTVSGHLGGKDSLTPNTTVKKAACLGALTWRANVAVLRGEDPTKVARIQPLRTLKQTAAPGAQNLKRMVFDFGGQAVALEYIREGLLVGVFGSKLVREGVVEGEGEGVEGDGEGDGDGKGEGSEEEVEGKMWAAQKKAAAMAEHLREELKGFRMPVEME